MMDILTGFEKLKHTLKLTHYQAVGIVRCLIYFHLLPEPRTAESLAAFMEWDQSPQVLWDALIECGYIKVIDGNKARLN